MNNKIKTIQQKHCLQWLKAQGVSQRRNLVLLSVLAITAFVIQLIIFWFVASIADDIIVKKSSPFESFDIVLLSILFIILLVVEKLKIILSERTERQLFETQQNTFFDILSSGQYALVRSQSTYFWQQVWLNHLPAVVRFNILYLVQQRFVMAVPIIVLAVVFPINWLIGLSLMITLPVVPLFMIVIGKGAAALHQRHFKALNRLGSIFVDRLKALTLLRIFNAHDKQSETLSDASDSLNQRTMQVVGVAFLSATALDFFSTLAVALVAVFVGFNLLGEFTLGGTLTLHTGLFLLLTAPLCFAELKQLGRLYHLRAEAIAVAETLIPIFSSTNNTDKQTEFIDSNDFLSFQWKKFSVGTPHIIAENINLTKGDKVLLKGNSGSGKTCFLEALMGQRQSTHSLKNAVLISQHAVILPTTIRENLALGKSIDDDALRTALKHVELDDWFNQQPLGLDTVLHEYTQMSGGQQQRLALARVLLCNAEVILLDEPTAHLTDEQHKRLSDMIQQTFVNKTVMEVNFLYEIFSSIICCFTRWFWSCITFVFWVVYRCLCYCRIRLRRY